MIKTTNKKERRRFMIRFSDIIINGDQKDFPRNNESYYATIYFLFVIIIMTITIILLTSFSIYHYPFSNNKNVTAVFNYSYNKSSWYIKSKETITRLKLEKLKIIYVYVMNDNNCNKYPYHNSLDYIFHSLNNTAINNNYYNDNHDIIFASNFKECLHFEEIFDEMNKNKLNPIKKFDISIPYHKSKKTENFVELANSFFQK